MIKESEGLTVLRARAVVYALGQVVAAAGLSALQARGKATVPHMIAYTCSGFVLFGVCTLTAAWLRSVAVFVVGLACVSFWVGENTRGAL